MAREWWAGRGDVWCGPCKSRSAALEKYRAEFPMSGSDDEVNHRDNDILSGFGTYGAFNDIMFHKQRPDK